MIRSLVTLALVPVWGARLVRGRKFAKRFLAFLAGFGVVWFLDPVQAVTNADRLSQAFFYRIVAPLYPPASGSPDSQELIDDATQIAVVVINDESLSRLRLNAASGKVEVVPAIVMDPGPGAPDKKGLDALVRPTWPPAHAIHAAVLNKILDQSTPKAILVDIGFFDERDAADTQRLIDVLYNRARPAPVSGQCDSLWGDCDDGPTVDPERRGSVPIFLIGAGKSPPAGLVEIDALYRAATGSASGRIVNDNPATYNLYELYDCAAELPSPALALFSMEQRWHAGRRSLCGRDKAMNAISVFWATWGDERNGRGAYRCRDLPDTAPGRLWLVITEWLAGWRDDALLQACPPHRSVAVQNLLSENFEHGWFMDGKYVLYGANFAMADDLVRPPAHGPIPGVFLHAMALDNLLRDQVKTERPAIGVALIVIAIVWGALCGAYLWSAMDALGKKPKALAKALARRGGARESPGTSSGRSAVFVAPLELALYRIVLFIECWSICLIGVLALVSLGFFAFDAAPINYVAIILVVALHSLMRLTEGALLTGSKVLYKTARRGIGRPRPKRTKS